ncbi:MULTISPECIES: OmcA/MtrC family decaheme c-type cytochrome [Shewanella]|uniref:OmcA/MtrC family decaheme c-type cytochrome n=2 Tax=Shewanella TaxID=22 RepID=A0ABX5WK30_9GAMM|nr:MULTISPECIES: OmcA/MtrC family decaheme c-type cytochrome [Shewanella]MCL1042143.1 OmcA/MtrC family decaheme c-type cytochrome [Shewanella marisflavi]QDF74819.1 OmcA/MtrC family decaheme c-type cytochrome [Shewanella marisflavi]
MMNVQHNKFKLLIAAGAVSMALTGCGGSDGKDGNPGNPGGPAADAIEVLHLDVTKVDYDNGIPTITVFATNEEDLPVIGLKDLEVKKVVQLLPQGATGAGNAAEWQFIGSQKAFTDHKDGNYTFTIDVEGYNSELTQRYNVIASASTLLDGVTAVPRTEIAEDFSGEGYEALYTKNVVDTASCNSCHAEGKKIYHSYTEVESCVSCHTQEMADDKGKQQVAFGHLIHNVHNDAKMYGRNMDKSAETAHHIVQDNCQTCHVQSEELTEWGNWSRVPTMETCTSCHVNVDFKAGKGHSQQNDNSNCVACHNASWTAELHTQAGNDKKALIDQYGLNVESVINAETKAATISIEVVDSSGAAVDINTILPMVQRFEIVTNVGPNNVTLGYYGKDLINAVKNGVLDAAAKIEDGKLVYTTSKDLKLGEEGADNETAFTFVGWAMCSDKGEFVTCDDPAFDGSDTDKYTGMKADLVFATLSGQAPSMRHVDSVNFTACASCHTKEFEVHKGSHHAGFVMSEQLSHTKDANDMPIIGVDACVACHTPDGTYAGGANMGALELKLHKVHSSGDYAVIAGMTCEQCHNDFNLDAFKNKGALATAGGTYTTPIAATCMSCHVYSPESEAKFAAHAEGQGAIVNGTDKQAVTEAAQLETCFYCHAPVIEDHTAVKM